MYNHKHSFSNPRFRNQTALTKHFWNIKDQELTPQNEVKIVSQSSNANSFNSRYNQCIEEKINLINFKGPGRLLNTRNELLLKCSHKINTTYFEGYQSTDEGSCRES